MVQARQIDAAGNTSVVSTMPAIEIDTSHDAIDSSLTADTDTGESNTDNITSNDKPTLKGNSESFSSIELTFDTIADETFKVVADHYGDWSLTLTKSLQEGVNDYHVKSIDLAGNETIKSFTVTVDTIAPTTLTLILAEDSGSSDSDNVTNIGQINVEGIEVNGSWQYSIDGGTTWLEGAGDSFVLLEGQYDNTMVQARQIDAAGNTSVVSTMPALEIDTSHDAIDSSLTADTDTGESNTDNITSNDKPTFEGTSEPLSTINLSFDTIAGETFKVTADQYGDWSITLTEALQEGVNDYHVKSVDLAGNVSDNTGSVTLDTQAPSIQWGTLEPEQSATGSVNSEDAGAMVELFDADGNSLGSDMVDNTGHWEIENPGYQSGDTVTISITDIAGNQETEDHNII